MAKTRMTTNAGRGMMSSTRGGFTIIEVVLVLAIAGLIFLMVFIALPALQRSQRDTQRRTDLGRMTEVITQYQTNNNGRLPGTSSCETVTMPVDKGTGKAPLPQNTTEVACRLITDYLNGVTADHNEFVDPDGDAYGIIIDRFGQGNGKVTFNEAFSPTYDHNIYIITNAACAGETIGQTNNTRDYAILYRLEGSGVYCQDNGGGAAGSGSSATK